MIHVFCRCFGYQGEQQHGRYFTRALSDLLEVGLHPWDELPDLSSLPAHTRTMLQNARDNNNIETGLGVGPMGAMTEIEGNKKIAFVVWETSKIPEQKLAYLDNVDEIWTTSTWGKALFLNHGLADSRVKIVPEGVDTRLFKPAEAPERRPQESVYRFLCVGKWEARKGMDRLIQAWCKAFKSHEKVELILHCHNPFIAGFDLRELLAQHTFKSAPIRISDPRDSCESMVDLYNNCDAFVLPTRAEGWGLPIIEAMACAKPVIVSNYSAHLEFANHDNAYLIDIARMIDVDDPFFFERDLDFGQWADPDVHHLAHLLRHVYLNREEAQTKGLKAREDIVSGWTWQHAAQKAARLL